jgi:hypothetical protein
MRGKVLEDTPSGTESRVKAVVLWEQIMCRSLPTSRFLPAPYCNNGKHAALKRPKLESEDRWQAGVEHPAADTERLSD